MAKQILLEEQAAYIPQLQIKEVQFDDDGEPHSEESLLFQGGTYELGKVTLEESLGDIRPDALTRTFGFLLAIEICVTHAVSSSKREKIDNHNVAAVEIDLRQLSYLTTKERLRELIVSDEQNKAWLCHPHEKGEREELKRRLNEKVRMRNLEIHKNRRARKVTSHPGTGPKIKKRVSKESPPKQPRLRTQKPQASESRWLRCEQCEHVWSQQTETLVGRTVTTCPECRYSVSTSPPLRRW